MQGRENWQSVTIMAMFSGLLQDPDEHLEVHLDEIRQPPDHRRGEEAGHSVR